MRNQLTASYFTPWPNGIGGQWHDQILQPDDVITISRSIRAFNVSQPDNTQTMTVCEALKSGAFDTSQGTMSVSAIVEFEDGTVGQVTKP